MKPENILMDAKGYVSLTDYGMSKFVMSKETTNSFCGTKEYLSPEMIIGSGHNSGNDWWGLGILIYELVFGVPPFYHTNQNFMYKMIV